LAGHHVHFPEDVTANTEIQLRMKGESIVNAHLGFLQHRHKYEIQLTVPITPGSTSLTPVINTPFIAVGNISRLGEFISRDICTPEDQLDRFSRNTQATMWIEESEE